MKWQFFSNKKQNGQYTIAFLLIAAAVAMGISLWIGLQQSVWFDEAYSVIVAKHEPAQIVQLTSVDVHPPLYYLLLHAWGGVFGWDEAPLRLMSVLAFGGSVVMAGLLARRLFGDRAAIVSAATVALSPLLLRYGFEIRMYSLASLIGVTATYVLVCARGAGKNAWRLWALYAVLVALGLLTLYHLALLWVAHAVWLVYVDRKKLRRFWELAWLRAFGAAAVLFVPWLPVFIGQLGNGALANIGQPMNMEQLIGVLSFNVFYKPLWQVNVIETVVLLALIALGGVAFMKVYQQKKARTYLLLLVAYIAVPIVLFMVASLVRPLYVERYLSHITIGLMVLAGIVTAGMVESQKKLSRLTMYAIGVVVLGLGVGNLIAVGNFNFQRMQKPAVALAANAIDCVGSTVVAADPYVAMELSYYLPPTCDLRFYSEWKKMGGGYAPFSDSPLRLSETKIPRLTNTLYYAYYDTPKLEIAPQYQQVGTQTNGGLTVATYEAR